MRTCGNCGKENPADASFCMACATPLVPAAAGREIRKTVTALFCDLVGSTSLAETHDPEMLRPLLERYFSEMRGAVERHGGRVEKFIGDAVVAIFGLPAAHEDDALRAVRAALEMQRGLRQLDATSPIPIAARIGVTTGEVLVSGGDTPLLGDAMNTASRLQSAAEPGGVLIGEPTWRLVRDAVDASAVEPLRVKGKADPVSAWRVIALHPVATRSATPFTGRDRHMRTLDEALADAVDARASVLVTILAPPGVGKSRLASAFADRVRGRATVLVGQTPPYGEGVTFAPLIELLAQAPGRPDGEAEEIAGALRDRLAAQADRASVGDRLAQFLGVGDTPGADTAWAVRRLLEVIAADLPLVVILEDAHWSEPPMLDVIEAVADRMRGPALFLCLARPELLERRPTWAAGKPRAMTTTLPPLSAEDTHRIAELLLGTGTPASVVDRVCDTAEGNPLYLEQLTAMLEDNGLLVDGRWVGSPDAAVEIPESLQALLAARLDRLDPEPRLVLGRASVEGRRFRMAAVRTLTPELTREAVEDAVASLDRSGLVQPEDETAGRWRFTHALVLEAAYRGLSKGERAELHERLADWMSREDPDQADVGESVARHLERALRLREELGLRDERSAALATRSGELFAKAGLRSFAALDFITSRDLLGRAAVLLPEQDPRRLDLLPNLGVALTETGRPEETEVLLAAAVEQSRAAGSVRNELRSRLQLLSDLMYRAVTDAEIDAAVVEAEAAMDALAAMDDEDAMAEAAIVLEYLEFISGRVARSHHWTLRALRHGLASGRFRESTQAAADIVWTSVAGPLPFDRCATVAHEQLFPLDEPIAATAGHALLAIGSLAAGDEAGFLAQDDRRREIVDRNGLSWLGAVVELETAFVRIWAGHAETAERRLREAREVLVALGDIWWVATLDSVLCSALRAQGRRREFLRLADAFDVSVQVQDRQIQVHRTLQRSSALLLRGASADAEVAARRGLELVETTDLVLDHADTLLRLTEALEARDLAEEAATARAEAAALLLAKGMRTSAPKPEG